MSSGKSEAPVEEVTTSTRKRSHYSTAVDAEELEFIQAIEDFKRKNNQPFPSWSEVLDILRNLGYSKE